jgi:DNA mismatch repair ATPase MutS
MQFKKRHPSKLIAMQVGDFFEFTGWDAVLVIQVTKIKGMGLSVCPHLPVCHCHPVGRLPFTKTCL